MHVKKKTQINYYFQINYKCKFQIHCFYNGLNGLGTLYRDNHAHLFLSKEVILNEALNMSVSPETKAAIGPRQRSCSDFPRSIQFHFNTRTGRFRPPANLCAIIYMTEISSTVTSNNQLTKTKSTYNKPVTERRVLLSFIST